MRNDHLKSRMKQHEKRNETKIDEKAIMEKLLQHQIEYSQQQAVGEFLSNLIDGDEIKEEDLQFNHKWKQSLIVYRKQPTHVHDKYLREQLIKKKQKEAVSEVRKRLIEDNRRKAVGEAIFKLLNGEMNKENLSLEYKEALEHYEREKQFEKSFERKRRIEEYLEEEDKKIKLTN